MQTLILTNPISTPVRPAGPASSPASTEGTSDLSFDLSVGLPESPPPEALIETLPFPMAVNALPDSGLSVRLEPIGAVQGLAEASLPPLLRDAPDIPMPEILALVAPLAMAGSNNPPAKVETAPVDPPKAAAVSLLPLLVQPAFSPGAADLFKDNAVPDPRQSQVHDPQPKAILVTDLPKLPGIALDQSPGSRLPPTGDLNGTAVTNVRPQGPEPVPARTLPQSGTSSPIEVSSRLWSQLGLLDVPKDERTNLPFAPAIGEMVSRDPKQDVQLASIRQTGVAAPDVAKPNVAGRALPLQAGLGAELTFGESEDLVAVADPALTMPRTRLSATEIIPAEGQATMALRWGRDLFLAESVFALSVASQDEDSAGTMPGLGSLPANGSLLAGSAPAASQADLQDLPKLAAQLAGTLVHRSDGQIEIALSPEDLGGVRLSMQADVQNPDRMVVMLTFEKPETLDLFRRYADQLADALRDAGYSGSDISFGWSGGETARDDANPDNPALARADPDPSRRNSDDIPSLQPSRSTSTRSLDLRV